LIVVFAKQTQKQPCPGGAG